MVLGAFRVSARRAAATASKSAHAPSFNVKPNVGGWTAKNVTNLGLTLAGFGSAAGVFVVFFFSDVPRFRKDVMQKFPIIGDRFVKEIPASDNPF